MVKKHDATDGDQLTLKVSFGRFLADRSAMFFSLFDLDLGF